MFRRHVDFFAVFFIALGLLALTQVSEFRFPMDSVRVESISAQMQACRLSSQIASHIVYVLSH